MQRVSELLATLAAEQVGVPVGELTGACDAEQTGRPALVVPALARPPC